MMIDKYIEKGYDYIYIDCGYALRLKNIMHLIPGCIAIADYTKTDADRIILEKIKLIFIEAKISQYVNGILSNEKINLYELYYYNHCGCFGPASLEFLTEIVDPKNNFRILYLKYDTESG